MFTIRKLSPVLGILVLFTAISVNAAEGRVVIPAELWGQARSSSSIIEIDGMRELILALEDEGKSSMVIYHPASNESTHKAEELRAWLVSLGVASSRMSFELSERNQDQLRIEIRH